MEINPRMAIAVAASLLFLVAAIDFSYGKLMEFNKTGASAKEFVLGAAAGTGTAIIVTIVLSTAENMMLVTKTTAVLTAILMALLVLLKLV